MSTLYPDLSLTNFPNSLDQFLTFLNIVASDGPLIMQYQSAMESGNVTLANQILSQIPQNTQKIITANSLNSLSQAILAIERFYLTDIEPYINNLQQSWLTTIQQFSYQGTWESGTSYIVNNLVSYTVSGLTLIYIAIATPPVGTLPTNTNYWRLLTIQGQQGTSGVGLSYRQQWSSSITYSTNDAVTYDGAVWMALQSNQNRIPDSNPSYWQLIMNLEMATYPIQDTVPTNLEIDGLWFNTSNNPTSYIYEGDVNDGKQLIATAITDMGVDTEATDSFSQMAANISQISSGPELVTGTFICGRRNTLILNYSNGTSSPQHQEIAGDTIVAQVLKNSLVSASADQNLTITGSTVSVSTSGNNAIFMVTGNFTVSAQ